jgi:hypothetical protein
MVMKRKDISGHPSDRMTSAGVPLSAPVPFVDSNEGASVCSPLNKSTRGQRAKQDQSPPHWRGHKK